MVSDRELMQQALEALENTTPTGFNMESDKRFFAAIKALRERLAQPEQKPFFTEANGFPKTFIPKPTMRPATREEKIDKPGVYWVPVDNIANSEAIPEQISERCPNCASLEAQNTELDRKLAEMEKGEPIGEIVQAFADLTAVSIPVMPPVGTKLYTTPPRREWYEGSPPFPQDQEWFIAETVYGDRVVLRSLDEGREHRGNYAFRTADETYMKAENVRRWMQFPDCEYTPPRREWVGLTEEEVAEMHNEIKVRLMGTYKTEDIYRAIEAKLKEKNA